MEKPVKPKGYVCKICSYSTTDGSNFARHNRLKHKHSSASILAPPLLSDIPASNTVADTPSMDYVAADHDHNTPQDNSPQQSYTEPVVEITAASSNITEDTPSSPSSSNHYPDQLVHISPTSSDTVPTQLGKNIFLFS